ncbi:uncharacterized protein ARMOST_12416 [Armillaria ostoyae]|uniref:Uncharacterized protein n=1 Tax=Armillaria ostoyae TaxID=47428 RepID=A0A284RJW1_ARMOS|nr:uncharacterized protein ARMOST_12416 [Armillaria ostoyae]
MAPKRQLDANSTGGPLSKRLRIAQPILQKCEALLEEAGIIPRTYSPLEILGLLLDGQSQQEEPPRDEDELRRDGENRLTVPDEYVSEPHHAYKFSEVSQTILKERLSFRFSLYDWSLRGFFRNATLSNHYADDLEPLYKELETIYSTSEPKAIARQVTDAYLSFVFATIKQSRETDIRNAIKARLEADPGLDIRFLMYGHSDAESHEQILSAYLESPEGAGLPSTLSEFSVDDKVNYILWCNRYVYPNRLLNIDGVGNTSYIRLYQEITIDSDDDDASYHDQNGREITLSGVVKYAMLVFKTRDEDQVRNASFGEFQKRLYEEKSLETRLLFLEAGLDNGRERDLRREPLIEASAQALALSRRFKRSNVRFIVTDSNDWVIAHLHNPLDGGPPEVTSYPLPHLYSEIPFQARYGTTLGRVKATQTWKTFVRGFYVTLLEWLLPESVSAIPTPPRFDQIPGSKI